MVGKKFISRVMEEFLGEYILNIPQESIKLAAVRGKLQVDNVELDGDLIGSQILGAVGLADGFAVLSCTAKTLRATIPWSKLEKEPTRFELIGLQLLCVPLLPSNANWQFGSGTSQDPKCSLRTRTKRAVLNRFERNFFNWRIPGEGPPRPNVRNQQNSKSTKNPRRSISSDNDSVAFRTSKNSPSTDDILNDLASHNDDNNSIAFSTNLDGKEEVEDEEKDMNESQRKSWIIKLRQKVFRNIEASITDIHLRCEVSEGALDNRQTNEEKPKISKSNKHYIPESRKSFAIGFTMDSLVYKSANASWQSGSNVDWDADRSGPQSSNISVDGIKDEIRRKVMQINKAAMYWDDDPPMLISESNIFKDSNISNSTQKYLSRMRLALEAMTQYQEPGNEIREALNSPIGTYDSPCIPHTYCISPSNLELRLTFNNIDLPGPTLCFAEIVPCSIHMTLQPYQYKQHRSLQHKLMAQRRLNTMIQQRPSQRPTKDPKGWWRWAISCVLAQPSSKPWREVQFICRQRSLYLHLAFKKILQSRYAHSLSLGPLSQEECSDLLWLEDVLPLETLLSFHLLAMRKVIKHQQEVEMSKNKRRSRTGEINNIPTGRHQGRASGSVSPPKMRKSSKNSKNKPIISFSPQVEAEFLSNDQLSSGNSSPQRRSSVVSVSEESASGVMNDDITLRTFYLRNVTLILTLMDKSQHPILESHIQSRGLFRNSPEDGFVMIVDWKKIHATDYIQKVLQIRGGEEKSSPEPSQKSRKDHESIWNILESTRSSTSLPNGKLIQLCGDYFLYHQLKSRDEKYSFPLPPDRIVVRFVLCASVSEMLVNIAAHASSMVWNIPCLKAIEDSFFSNQTNETRTVLKTQLLNAATKQAHKAQLALISPKLIRINFNVEPPKLVFPISPNVSDGAVTIHSERMRLSINKLENVTSTQWVADAKTIELHLVRDVSDITFVKPFNIHVHVDRIEEGIKNSSYRNTVTNLKALTSSNQLHLIRVECTKISLNLVDVDTLAKAIGKWYATQIMNVKQLSTKRPAGFSAIVRRNDGSVEDTFIQEKSDNLVELFVSVEEVSMILQSEGDPSSSDFNDLLFQDDDGVKKRTYLIQIGGVSLTRGNEKNKITTKLCVSTIDIVQMKSALEDRFHKGLYPSDEARHHILICEGNQSQVNPISNSQMISEAISLRMVQDNTQHLNDIDLHVSELISRATLTSLKDCFKTLNRIAELLKLVTKEMERMVHDHGRTARVQNQKIVSDNRKAANKDSSLFFKVEFDQIIVLAGWSSVIMKDSSIPTNQEHESHVQHGAIIQLCSKVLIMYQSIEDSESAGTKTMHVSLSELSTSVNTEFEPVSIAEVPPMVGPLALELHSIHTVESSGTLVSREFSLDLDALKSFMTPNDFYVLVKVFRKLSDKVKNLHKSYRAESNRSEAEEGLSTSSASVTTSIIVEMQPSSIVLLRDTDIGRQTEPALKFDLELRGKFEGVGSSLGGELRSVLASSFFLASRSNWEYVLEPFSVLLDLERTIKHMNLGIVSENFLNVTLTNHFLKELTKLKLQFLGDDYKKSSGKKSNKIDPSLLTPSAMSKKALQKATNHKSMYIVNDSGADFIVSLQSHSESQPIFDVNCRGCILLKTGGKISVDELGINDISEGNRSFSPKLSIQIARSSERILGKREPIYNLPVGNYEDSFVTKYSLDLPVSDLKLQGNQLRKQNLEPVTDWCVENQRLRSIYHDISNLRKGDDLLSSIRWSPKADQSDKNECNWMYPYLENDRPEWSDMTGCMRISQESFMLPDSNWMWVNEWHVEINGEYGESNDADGWEYAEDFTKFGVPRYYRKGDTCRRRTWARTRVIKPPRLNDPLRKLSIVWRSVKEKNGSYTMKVTSPLHVHNQTDLDLAIFLYSPNWDDDKFSGIARSGVACPVPINLTTAMYLRLGIRQGDNIVSHQSRDFFCSDRVMILSSNQTSSSYLWTSMEICNNTERKSSSSTLQFLIHVDCKLGITDVYIQPVLKLLNLLPCLLKYRLAECKTEFQDNSFKYDNFQSSKIKIIDEQQLDSGDEAKIIMVDPCRMPVISFRVPGYKWSPWKKIINRLNHIETISQIVEESANNYEGDADKGSVSAYESVVKFEKLLLGGDPLHLVFSIKSGLCPSLCIYSQYIILDKTGLGLRFADGYSDILGTTLLTERSRHSYLPSNEEKSSYIKNEFKLSGHSFPIGMNGTCLYFSNQGKISVAIGDNLGRGSTVNNQGVKSDWSSLLDIGTITPNLIFTLNELNGKCRYDFSYNVSYSIGKFHQTKILTILPRYQIINLLNHGIFVSQEGNVMMKRYIEKRSVLSNFHWTDKNRNTRIQLCLGDSEFLRWTEGSIPLEKCGVHSLRIPHISGEPVVIQVEVRLATKDQNSAVVVVFRDSLEDPLYLLRNSSSQTIICRQLLNDELAENKGFANLLETYNNCSALPTSPTSNNLFQCGRDDSVERKQHTWLVPPGKSISFGLEDPSKRAILEWSCKDEKGRNRFVVVDLDELESSVYLKLSTGKKIKSRVLTEGSTKVLEFFDEDLLGKDNRTTLKLDNTIHEDRKENNDARERMMFSVVYELPGAIISVLDDRLAIREILQAHIGNIHLRLSRKKDNFDEVEVLVTSLQIDNHIANTVHPVLLSGPQVEDEHPFLHLSVVRRLSNLNDSSLVFTYLAFRILNIDLMLDRRTLEALLTYMNSIWRIKDMNENDLQSFLNIRSNENVDEIYQSKLSKQLGRVYIEQLHLHPIRISVTFTQDWNGSDKSGDIPPAAAHFRLLPSLKNASLVFTSFVVSHVFEVPMDLIRIIRLHYLSQLTKQFFTVIGSLEILNVPLDFVTNVGTGVRDFFYEPINGLVHGPDKFIEGLESGSIKLARGVFVGFVRGAANVTWALNSNLAGLTDESFVQERNAHQKSVTDTLSQRIASRSLTDSLAFAGESVAHGLRSGASGIFEQPYKNFAKFGTAGIFKGVGQGLLGAIVKPLIGVGDGAVLMMNHLSDITSDQNSLPKAQKRLRRALTYKFQSQRTSLLPYNIKAAKAQKVVTSNETNDDVYIGHVETSSHLIIASERCLYILKRKSDQKVNYNWEDISHFEETEGKSITLKLYSEEGIESISIDLGSTTKCTELIHLLSTRTLKMGNCRSTMDVSTTFKQSLQLTSLQDIPGLRKRNFEHTFGSLNNEHLDVINGMDALEVLETSYDRIRRLKSDSPNFLKSIDEEACILKNSWRYFFSGLSSRRCVIVGLINGSGVEIQVKSTKLIEGASPCYQLPSRYYEEDTSILHPLGSILFFAWGGIPSFSQAGHIRMNIETNAFFCEVSDQKGMGTSLVPSPGFDVGFLEKSFDKGGFWAKYWLLVTKSPR